MKLTPAAGVTEELALDKENEFVCDLDENLCSEHAAMLLARPDLYPYFSNRSHEIVGNYTFGQAAAGFVNACRRALSIQAEEKNAVRGSRKPRVVIVERQLLQYRVAAYERLRTLLDKEGIDLQLLIGEGTPDEVKKKNQTSLDWAIRLPTHYLLGGNLCWQPFGSHARDADLVIVMHENKLIYNLWLLFFDRPRRLAFWGHGRNMQSSRPNGWRERFKRWTVNKVDWWFAYTESSAMLVNSAGFPRERITVVENAVDTAEMTALCNDVSTADCRSMHEKLRLGTGPIGLYLGSLYREKRLEFLLDAAQRIRKYVPDFQLLVVGAGPDQTLIEAAERQHPWIHYLGPLQDREKAKALVIADVILNPGLVGLGILDSFVSGTPMFTTDCGLHSPEISYLVSGENGVMTANDIDAYTNAIIAALSDPVVIEKLQEGARSTALRYTVENMAERLTSGIRASLSMPSNRSTQEK